MTVEQIKIIIDNLHREIAHEEMSSSQRAQMNILEILMDRMLNNEKKNIVYQDCGTNKNVKETTSPATEDLPISESK